MQSSLLQSSWLRRAAAIALLLGSGFFYFAGQRKNPPAFYSDESSIAYNAWTMATKGVDEYGIRHPLYFKAFGEYKNPVYIYLLAGVFKVARPTNLTVRRFSALLGFAAALALGALAWSLTRRGLVAVATFLTAIATPNLFEISRLAFEVALFPLIIALMLAAVLAAHRRTRWNAWMAIELSVTLALITYTYSTGRLLGVLYAAGLLILYTRERRWQLAAVYALYAAMALLPIAVYNARHHGALTIRARQISYVSEWRAHPADVVAALERNYAANLLPLGQVFRGDPNARHHVQQSGGNVLLMTFILAALGAWIVLRRAPRDRFWLFVVFAAIVSPIAVSVINETYHSLRIVPYPEMLIVLSIPALEYVARALNPARGDLESPPPRWLRAALAMALLLGVIQASYFFFHFFRYGANRGDAFDAGIRNVVYETAAQPLRPIHVFRAGMYVHVLWYAVQGDIPLDAFVVDPDGSSPPAGALFIAPGEPCPDCRLVSRHGNFSSYYLPP